MVRCFADTEKELCLFIINALADLMCHKILVITVHGVNTS